MTASVRELLTPLIVGKKPDEFVFTRDGAPYGLPSVDLRGNNALQGHFEFAA